MEQTKDELPRDVPPYRWFIAVLADGKYRFIIPQKLASIEKYIGEHGGGIYSHAGYLIMAANKTWWNFLSKQYDKEWGLKPLHLRPPHIDIPNIECIFSEDGLKWLQDNEELLKEQGGKYYDNIPNH